MKYISIPVTHYQQNCSVLWCEETKDAAVIDPGGDVSSILSVIEAHGLRLQKILLTHGHLDHVGGAAELALKLTVPIIGPHKDDQFWLDMLDTQAQMMGFTHAETFSPNHWLQEGEQVSVGHLQLEVIHCPGHTPGHIVFYNTKAQIAFVGDVLFNGSIGRTDFPKGNHEQLIDAIHNKLLPLGDGVRFIPGHGPESTFGYEKQHNPFVSGVYG